MSQTAAPPPAVAIVSEDVTPAELHLGKALALIHRVLPRLDELERATDIDSALRAAAAQIEAARAAHAHQVASAQQALAIDGEVVALIAAAVAAVLGRPHRVLGVEKVPPAVTWVNAWAIEGRFQHYSSHKVR